MATEKPEARIDVEFGEHMPFAELSAVFGDCQDAIHHEHIWRWKLRIALAK